MRKIVYGINLTIDGYCDHTSVTGSESVHQYFTRLMQEAGLIIYGRKTYELMVPYWPDVARNQNGKTTELDFARAFNAVEKVVFSTSLEAVGENTRLFRSNLKEEVLKLKQEPGKVISVGGVDLPTQLIAMGLVDEFHFVIHPVIAGKGRRLFDNTAMDRLDLRLVQTKNLEGGAVALHYVSAEG